MDIMEVNVLDKSLNSTNSYIHSFIYSFIHSLIFSGLVSE